MVNIGPITSEDRPSLRMLELLCIREYVEMVMKKSWDSIGAESGRRSGEVQVLLSNIIRTQG